MMSRMIRLIEDTKLLESSRSGFRSRCPGGGKREEDAEKRKRERGVLEGPTPTHQLKIKERSREANVQAAIAADTHPRAQKTEGEK